MTTDITELAQRTRINAECGEHLSPAETMELVEALEKARQYGKERDEENQELMLTVGRLRAEREAQLAQACDHSMFWDVSGVKRCSKCDSAEMESRTVTVKLPRPGFVTISGERTAVYLKADVDAAMLAAGIEETE